MSHLQIISNPKQQPQSVPRINRASRLGKKIRFAFVAGSPKELCTGANRGGTFGTYQKTARGKAYLPAATATTWAVQIPDLDPHISGSFTVNWHGYVRTNVQGFLLQSLGSGCGWQFFLEVNTPGSSYLALYGINSGAYRPFPITVADNSLHSLSVVWDFVAGNAELFLDGVSIGISWWIQDGVNQGSAQTFGMYDGSAGTPQQTLTVQAYAGALNAKEIKWMADNPYAFIDRGDISIYYSAAAAGGGFNPAWARRSNVMLDAGIMR